MADASKPQISPEELDALIAQAHLFPSTRRDALVRAAATIRELQKRAVPEGCLICLLAKPHEERVLHVHGYFKPLGLLNVQSFVALWDTPEPPGLMTDREMYPTPEAAIRAAEEMED